MTPLCAALQPLLPQYAPRYIEGAMPYAFPPGEQLYTLAEAAAYVSAYLSHVQQETAEEKKYRQGREEIAEIHASCKIAVARHIREVEEFAWFYPAEEALARIREQQAEIKHLRRIVGALWVYIERLPYPGEE